MRDAVKIYSRLSLAKPKRRMIHVASYVRIASSSSIQFIISNSADLLSTGHLETNFSEILISYRNSMVFIDENAFESIVV